MRLLPFAILKHERQVDSHWDWLFDFGADGEKSLLTFRSRPFPAPCFTSSRVIDFIPLAAHRRLYLSYQGPVSGGRGFVRQIDRGEWLIVGSTEYKQGAPIFMQLHGRMIHGDLAIHFYGPHYARGHFHPAN